MIGASGAESGGGGKAFYCTHTVEMHQLESVVPPEQIPPPETEPPPTVPTEEPPPPETEPPEEIPAPTAESPTTAPPAVPVTQNTLPTTGNEVLVMLGIGALLIAVGAMLVAQARRSRVDDVPSALG